MERYKIVRYYKDSTHPDHQKIIKRGLTRQEAMAHCSRPDTCEEGVWFDAFLKIFLTWDNKDYRPYSKSLIVRTLRQLSNEK